MRPTIKLGSRNLDSKSKPYVIAEIGVNHEGSMVQAKKLIDLAREGGADAAKFQSYKADTLASKHSPAYWDRTKEKTSSQHALFQKYDNFSANDYKELSEYCDSVGIAFVSTPFDDASIEFLDPIMPFYKIASADLTNTPFLRKIAKKGKPVILSTGASTLEEISAAVTELEAAGCKELALLHCILNYPTPDIQAHLGMIRGLKQAFPENIIGYSDHTLPDDAMTSLCASQLLGAVIIEKHFTHDKTLPGNDHYHAMDVHDLKRFISLSEKINVLLGPEEDKAPIESEAISRENARRSIVLKHNLAEGHMLCEGDITYKRPGSGISPASWDDVIGSILIRALESDHVLKWEDIK